MLARGRVVIDLVVISPPRYEVPATLVDIKYKLNMVSQIVLAPKLLLVMGYVKLGEKKLRSAAFCG